MITKLFVPLPLQTFTERTEKMNMTQKYWIKVLNLVNIQDYFPVLNFPRAMVFIYWIKKKREYLLGITSYILNSRFCVANIPQRNKYSHCCWLVLGFIGEILIRQSLVWSFLQHCSHQQFMYLYVLDSHATCSSSLHISLDWCSLFVPVNSVCLGPEKSLSWTECLLNWARGSTWTQNFFFPISC